VPSVIDDPLISTFGRLVEASNQLERRLGRDLEAQCGLPHVWFEVLIRLVRSTGGQLTMGELAEQVALTTGGITRLIDRMQAAGFVRRQPGQTDRRVSHTAITDSGRAKLDEGRHVSCSQPSGRLRRTQRPRPLQPGLPAQQAAGSAAATETVKPAVAF
jgi:MarR family transcriptional regulator, 2-MHQ and catechol-resistance regulon repressor